VACFHGLASARQTSCLTLRLTSRQILRLASRLGAQA